MDAVHDLLQADGNKDWMLLVAMIWTLLGTKRTPNREGLDLAFAYTAVKRTLLKFMPEPGRRI